MRKKNLFSVIVFISALFILSSCASRIPFFETKQEKNFYSLKNQKIRLIESRMDSIGSAFHAARQQRDRYRITHDSLVVRLQILQESLTFLYKIPSSETKFVVNEIVQEGQITSALALQIEEKDTEQRKEMILLRNEWGLLSNDRWKIQDLSYSKENYEYLKRYTGKKYRPMEEKDYK
ncbi:MAG: hypothetical protein HYW78_03695 [Parcubacteria group bacterium]|nr:hypothetical protein [Parcubacteria group bacterium]